MNSKQLRGLTAYHSGLAAEDIVAEQYARAGHAVLARRWRGTCGEIDLIARDRDNDGVIFIEVKKSRSHAQAAARLTHRQLERIFGAGSEFLGTQPNGQLTAARIDIALVNSSGQVSIIENASMMA